MFNVFESYNFCADNKVFTEYEEIIYWNNGLGFEKHL